MTAAMRFSAKVEITPGCWNWLAYKTSKGYGKFGFGRAVVLAHRYAWEAEYGPIPDGLFVCHRCDNPSCVRPEHLFLGTVQDNQRDAKEKERFPRGDKNHRAKLTESDVRDIRARVAAGEAQKDVAADYKVHFSSISNIVRRKNWGWLLAALLMAGCHPSPTSSLPITVIPADSTRWVQQEKDQPYALFWRDGTVNLWVRMDSHITSPDYPYPTARYRYSAVCRGRVSSYYMASGTLVTSGGLDNCTVTDGSFSVTLEGDSLWRGLVTTTVAVPSCGTRTDTLWLRLARVQPTENNDG